MSRGCYTPYFIFQNRVWHEPRCSRERYFRIVGRIIVKFNLKCRAWHEPRLICDSYGKYVDIIIEYRMSHANFPQNQLTIWNSGRVQAF